MGVLGQTDPERARLAADQGEKMSDHQLFWGDFHTHFLDFDGGDEVLRDARENVDFCAVLCYPFVWDWKDGFRMESVQQRSEFSNWWERLKELNRAHYDPGNFTTFLGYEWHGNRTRYGDHNVIYCDEDAPLDDAWELPDLYRHLRERRAFAIPHHTGYLPEWRGRDWSVFDEALSPVMEVFSTHGSSEGEDLPRPMESNGSMGPRVTGGTFQDALARGLRIGVIGSNDGGGLQGRWGIGRAAAWATECTREGIWEAILARRTYAVTGDRMELEFCIEGAPMGAVIEAGERVDVEVAVAGTQAIDRIELVHDGVVADSYCHSGSWEREADREKRFKVFVEAGWGPVQHYGFERGGNNRWECRLELEGGELEGVERCFSLFGQRVRARDRRSCEWNLVTAFRRENQTPGMTQGIVAEMWGDARTRLRLELEGVRMQPTSGELLKGSLLVPLLEESKRRVAATFGLEEKDVTNPDAYFHNARKIKIHRAIPESGYRAKHTFRQVALKPGRNYLYVRASQLNGQLAWSSPIWVDVR